MNLSDLLNEVTICCPVVSNTRSSAIQELLNHIQSLGYLSTTIKLYKYIEEFENNHTTAAGKGHMNFSYPKKVLNNDIEPGFKNELALKDLKLALDHGIKEGIDLKTGKCILPIYEEAVNSKYKDLDWTAMYNFIKEKNKLD